MEQSLISWVGGKARQANWIVKHIECIKHTLYVEPFCGGASVFFRKKQSPVEVLNDTDGGIVRLFRILRKAGIDHELCTQLFQHLNLTPYSRQEFTESRNPIPDEMGDLEAGRRLFVRYNQAWGGRGQYLAANPGGDGGWARTRTATSGGRAVTVAIWERRATSLFSAANRLKDAQIECRDALKVIKEYDRKFALMYLDPPYLPGSSSAVGAFAFPMSVEDHAKLLRLLVDCKSKVLLSGYNSEMYNDYLVSGYGWVRRSRTTRSTLCQDKSKNRNKEEILWINGPAQGDLLGDTQSSF